MKPISLLLSALFVMSARHIRQNPTEKLRTVLQSSQYDVILIACGNMDTTDSLPENLTQKDVQRVGTLLLEEEDKDQTYALANHSLDNLYGSHFTARVSKLGLTPVGTEAGYWEAGDAQSTSHGHSDRNLLKEQEVAAVLAHKPTPQKKVLFLLWRWPLGGIKNLTKALKAKHVRTTLVLF